MSVDIVEGVIAIIILFIIGTILMGIEVFANVGAILMLFGFIIMMNIGAAIVK